jgi:branched-chain amino acid aminotransferase
LGWQVREQTVTVAQMLDWVQDGEAALSGTAAVLAGVGTLVRGGVEHRVGDGEVGPETRNLRSALIAIHQGLSSDRHGWLTNVPRY